MYKMMIDISGQHRVFEFRGPRCRTKMLEWWDDHLRRAEGDEDIRSICVWGTVGGKTEIVLAWPPERFRRLAGWLLPSDRRRALRRSAMSLPGSRSEIP